MTMPVELFLIVILLAALSGLLVGWDLAVHNHRAARKTLETRAADLDVQFARFREDLSRDPQRAWIDIGKRNVLSQMEQTVRAIRASLESST